jgi:hypothetical protein
MSLTAIFFLVAFSVGCTLAFVRHPVYGLMTYIATLYLDPTGQWWGNDLMPQFRWELLPAVITLLAMAIHRGRGPSPLFRSGLFRGICVFIAWLVIQLPWTVSPTAQEHLLTIWSKFLVVSFMICGCVDSWKHLRLVLWSNVLGCTYMGWLAHSLYNGGRFGNFGLSSIQDANTGALVLVTGLLAAASLFLAANRPTKLALILAMGLMADGVIATVSREGFLELACGGLAFILFAPKEHRLRVIGASLLALCGFLALSPSYYWQRIDTVQYLGAKIQHVDTGHSRVAIMKGQWQMFKEHPLGCGHECTQALSPQFIPSKYLTSSGVRASHSTFMTMLVDQGIPGVLLYFVYLWWTFRTIKRVIPSARRAGGFPATILPGLIGILIAIPIGDIFGSFQKLEARVWFLSLLVTYARLLQVSDPVGDGSLSVESNASPPRGSISGSEPQVSESVRIAILPRAQRIRSSMTASVEHFPFIILLRSLHWPEPWIGRLHLKPCGSKASKGVSRTNCGSDSDVVARANSSPLFCATIPGQLQPRQVNWMDIPPDCVGSTGASR